MDLKTKWPVGTEVVYRNILGGYPDIDGEHGIVNGHAGSVVRVKFSQWDTRLCYDDELVKAKD